jgi:hypothetical protein
VLRTLDTHVLRGPPGPLPEAQNVTMVQECQGCEGMPGLVVECPAPARTEMPFSVR